jgi:hypothetical protein
VGDEQISKATVELGKLTVAGSPAFSVELLPAQGAAASQSAEIELTPGKMTRALLRVKRSGFKDRITFDVDNLPFGVIVADIGLNGVLIPPDQSEREIFLQCSPWVGATVRPCFAVAKEAGNPTSAPVSVRVRPLERR